jgi:osmotically-inducible protein OsmY
MNLRHKPLLGLLLAALMAGCASSQTSESTGEYIDDSVVTTRVKSAFVQDEAVNALDIKVKTYKGRVQLSGFADDPKTIERAVSIARATPGVKSVANDIRLKSP